MQNTHEVRGNGMPVALGPIKEPQNLHLTIFLKNPLYTSWAICVYLLLACCKSPNVKHHAFLPTLQPSSQSRPWESERGDGDSGSKKKSLCLADSSLLAESAKGMQGDLHKWQDKAAHFPAAGKTRIYGSQFFRVFFLMLPRLLQKGSSPLDPVPCGLCKSWDCTGSPVMPLGGWPRQCSGWPADPSALGLVQCWDFRSNRCVKS